MGRKHTRRNYYKNSTAKKRNRIIKRVVLSVKTAAVIAALLLVSFVFIFSYDFLTQCDYFKISHMTIEGTQRLSEKEIARQAQVDKGVNILAVNLSLVRKRLLAHPWIAEAGVSREIPSGLSIRIKPESTGT